MLLHTASPRIIKFTIADIHLPGDPSEEYVDLVATEDTDLRNHILFDNTFTAEGELSNKKPNCYVFAPRKVKKGQSVRLYTGYAPTASTFESEMQMLSREIKAITTYPEQILLYWNLDECVWNNTGDTATLINVADYISASASSLSAVK